MKTNKPNYNQLKRAVLLAIIGGMTALPLMAQTPLTVSGSNLTETGTTHTTGAISSGTYQGTDVVFTGVVAVGTDGELIATSSTFQSYMDITGSGAKAVLDHVTAQTIYLRSGTNLTLQADHLTLNLATAMGLYNSVGTGIQGVSITVDNLTVNAYNPNQAVYIHGIFVSGDTVVSGSNWTFNHTFDNGTNCDSFMMNVSQNSSLIAKDVTVNFNNTNSGMANGNMIAVNSSGYVQIDGLDLTFRSNESSASKVSMQGIALFRNVPDTVTDLKNVTIDVDGSFRFMEAILLEGQSAYTGSNGRMDIENLTMTVNNTMNTGTEGDAAIFSGQRGGVMNITGTQNSIVVKSDNTQAIVVNAGQFYAENLTVETRGTDSRALNIMGNGTRNYTAAAWDSSTTTFVGGTLKTAASDLIYVKSGTNDTTINLSNVALSAGNGVLVNVAGAGNLNLTLDGSTQGTGTMQIANTRQLDLTLQNGAGYTGDLTLDDAAVSQSASVKVLNGAVLTGNLTYDGSRVETVTVDGGVVNGDLNNTRTGNLIVNAANGAVLTGMSNVAAGAVTDMSLDNAMWNLTGRSRLTTLTTDNGSITIANVQGEDLTVGGGISGQTALNLTLSDGVKGRQEIHVVVDETDTMTGDAFSLGNTVSTGMQTYGLENRLDGAWLVLGGGAGGGFTGGGDAVLNTAGAVSGFWFTQLDNLHKRMGELRYNAPSKGNLIENVWIRSYGQQANINTGISGVKGFSETQYGVDLGTDHLWQLDANNQLYTGIFAGYGGADRDFHTGYNGNTDSGYGGLYGTWIHQDGWYADAVAKGQYFRNDFDGEDHGKYDSVGVGLSLELGRQFQFADGWFAEPSVQVSYVHLMNDNYVTDNGLAVDLNDSDVIQFYGGARFGRNIKLSKDGWLQPYVKVGGIEQVSSGGQVKASGGEWRPTTDGARAVIGAGIVYQLDDRNQLHFDYEAAFGDKYDKPWGLNFGYRHQF